MTKYLFLTFVYHKPNSESIETFAINDRRNSANCVFFSIYNLTFLSGNYQIECLKEAGKISWIFHFEIFIVVIFHKIACTYVHVHCVPVFWLHVVRVYFTRMYTLWSLEIWFDSFFINPKLPRGWHCHLNANSMR